MMPDPVPPAWPPETEMVTTLGLAFAATAVIWFTESVSLTTMFWASALSLAAGDSLLVTRAVMPAPEAPPMRAAATIAAATPSPTRRCFGAAAPVGAWPGAPVIGVVGWVAYWGCAGCGPPNAGGACPDTRGVGGVWCSYWGAW